MGTRGPSVETLQGFLDAYHRNGCNLVRTSDQFGISRATLQHWEKLCVRRGLKPNVEVISAEEKAAIARLGERVKELERENGDLRAKITDAVKPRFTIRQDIASSGSKIRVVAIPDAHDSPNIPDKSRFEWIGAYINETKPDVVVQIGDFVTLDSLNSHTPNHTFAGKAKPSFEADMASFNTALDALDSKLNFNPEKHCNLGNHERRLFTFEDIVPEIVGMMQFKLSKIFENHKWTFSPYGEITFYGGVGFVHVPLNKLGKSYGGKTAANRIAADALFSLVHGHDHLEGMHVAPKIGHNRSIEVVDIGCALPDQHVEDYCFHAATGWKYGIADLLIQNGHIRDYAFVSMKRLEEQYA